MSISFVYNDDKELFWKRYLWMLLRKTSNGAK